jgi:hypothetical protein
LFFLVPIDPDNEDAWAKLEKKYYHEIWHMAHELEKNKRLTGETRNVAGMADLKEACRKLGRFKAQCLRQVAFAIKDEEHREFLRSKALSEEKNAVRIKDMEKHQEEDRHKFRIYIRTLQHDNEVSAPYLFIVEISIIFVATGVH